MNIASMRNIGAFAALVTSVFPQAAGSAVNGTSIDRFAHNMPLSCVLHTVVGAEAGSPTAISVVSKLQHSPDDSTWADYDPPGSSTVAESAALTAADTENGLAIDLSAADRYIRAVTTPTLTGGTSPTVEVVADLILGGEPLLPAA